MSSTTLSYGVGASAAFADHWRAVLYWHHYEVGDAGKSTLALEGTFDAVTLGLLYRF